jgi:RNA polymerase sigma-70 factor (ECF subfamily)
MTCASDETGTGLLRFFTERWLDAEPTVSAFIFACVRDFHHAEDLVQTVAMDAASSVETFDRSRPFGPWIMGIARNRVLKYYRKRSNDLLRFDVATLDALAEAHQSVMDEAADRRRALAACVEDLGDKLRTAIEMRYRQDAPAAQIAHALGMTSNAVFVMLHRTRNALLECIERRLGERGSAQ